MRSLLDQNNLVEYGLLEFLYWNTLKIFGLPGIGRLLLNAIMQRDFPLIQGTVLFMTISTIIINIVIDILYIWLNPKLKDKISYE